MSKLTPWFPGDVKPVRVGVYEITGCSFGGINYRVWTGKGWSDTRWEPSDFHGLHPKPMYFPGDDMTGWRGLASDPNARKK